MPIEIHWSEIALRLCLTLLAGGIIGLNRGEHGHPAGLRTTLLVALAACVSMIEVNLLLSMRGKTPDSFAVMDLMRLPLGILSGMGFIGAGAILRKDSAIRGVTTAATLWFVTVMGLCFGGGQLALGCITGGLGWLVLYAFKPVEHLWNIDRQATLVLVSGVGGPDEKETASIVAAGGYRVSKLAVKHENGLNLKEIRCDVKWESREKEVLPPEFVNRLANRPGVLKVEWNP